MDDVLWMVHLHVGVVSRLSLFLCLVVFYTLVLSLGDVWFYTFVLPLDDVFFPFHVGAVSLGLKSFALKIGFAVVVANAPG